MLTHVCATSCAITIADASPMSLLTVLPNFCAHVEPNAAKPKEKIGQFYAELKLFPYYLSQEGTTFRTFRFFTNYWTNKNSIPGAPTQQRL